MMSLCPCEFTGYVYIDILHNFSSLHNVFLHTGIYWTTKSRSGCRGEGASQVHQYTCGVLYGKHNKRKLRPQAIVSTKSDNPADVV